MQAVDELANWMSSVYDCEVETMFLDESVPVWGEGYIFVKDPSDTKKLRCLLVNNRRAIGEVTISNWKGETRGLELIAETLEILVTASTPGERLEAFQHIESKTRSGEMAGLPEASRAFAGHLNEAPFKNQAMLLMGQGIEADFFRKIALDLHESTGRWAFLNINDLEASAFASHSSILELGPMTIFIPELGDVRIETQIRLMEFLAIQPSENMPQIIASTALTMRELVAGGRALSGLLERLYVCTISEDAKKSESHRQQGVLNLVDYLRTRKGVMDVGRNTQPSGDAQIH